MLEVISSIGFLDQTADYLNSRWRVFRPVLFLEMVLIFFACVLWVRVGERTFPAASQFL